MPILNSIAVWLMKKRMHQVELFMKYPNDVQQEWFYKLIKTAKETEWGKRFDFASISNYTEFTNRVPLQDYDSIKHYIDRLRKGEQNILWPTEIKWFAKSSGTTNDKSKFIPISIESLEECHYRGGKDMITFHCSNNAESQLFTGKNLALGGSYDVYKADNYESYFGDVSAIIIQHLPMWAEYMRLPQIEIALMSNWNEKLEKLALSTMEENVTSIAGVPSWMLVLLKKILEIKKCKTIDEVWPNLEVYFHGGINFAPYREQFKSLMPSGKMSFLETYNASEGFFGIQDVPGSDELLLMLDYGIFYEFIPVEDLGQTSSNAIPLEHAELNKNYAVVISTNAGLWRYQLGDTIRFTNLNPYRFKISGRTKHFINAFGEELMVDNAEKALAIACEKSGAIITDFTAGPVFMEQGKSGAHEWLIEFTSSPSDLNYFTEVLDNALKSINSDYESKRFGNYILKMPVITSLPVGSFYNWLNYKNKLGGQNKVPRLANNRVYIQEILMVNKT